MAVGLLQLAIALQTEEVKYHFKHDYIYSALAPIVKFVYIHADWL